MMMECPKCGFQQPEDQFCAQCGINIETYKNKPIPKAKKLWNRLSVQISLTLVLLTILSTVLYIKNNQPTKPNVTLSEVWDKEFSQTNSPPQLDSSENSQPSPEPQNSANTVEAENSFEQKASPQPSLDTQKSEHALAANNGADRKFNIAVVEAPMAFLTRLDSSITPLNEELTIGYVEFEVQDLARWLAENNSQLLVLEPLREHLWHRSSFVQYNEELAISEGLSLQSTITFRPMELSNSSMTAQLEVRFSNITPNDSTPQVNKFSIRSQPNKAVAVFGFFPKTQNPISQEQIAPENRLFSVLASPEYVSGASDVALIFVLK